MIFYIGNSTCLRFLMYRFIQMLIFDHNLFGNCIIMKFGPASFIATSIIYYMLRLTMSMKSKVIKLNLILAFHINILYISKSQIAVIKNNRIVRAKIVL